MESHVEYAILPESYGVVGLWPPRRGWRQRQPESDSIAMLSVQNDLLVSMDYQLKLADGQIVDSSEGRDPLQFVQGRHEIIAGLESQLYGMSVGEEKDVVVSPADGYGEFDTDLFETLPRSIFPSDMALEPGMGFRMRADTGETVIAYVESIEDDRITMNLNHPLAGKTLYFHVKIVDLREATPEELKSGCGGNCSDCDHQQGSDEA